MTAFRLVCSTNEETKDVLEKRALFNIVIDEQVVFEYGFSPYITTNSGPSVRSTIHECRVVIDVHCENYMKQINNLREKCGAFSFGPGDTYTNHWSLKG
jgi:hypothetical protein